VQALNQVLGELPGATASNAVQQPRPFPTAIAIQSEERPDLRTVHLFNERRSGDGTVGQTDDDGTGAVPYTLTVRNLNAAQRVGGGGDPDEHQTNASSTGEPSNNNNTNVLFSNNRKIQAICEHASRHGKSSIELVGNWPSQPSTQLFLIVLFKLTFISLSGEPSPTALHRFLLLAGSFHFPDQPRLWQRAGIHASQAVTEQ
jgi:hypothetical protein